MIVRTKTDVEMVMWLKALQNLGCVQQGAPPNSPTSKISPTPPRTNESTSRPLPSPKHMPNKPLPMPSYPNSPLPKLPPRD